MSDDLVRRLRDLGDRAEYMPHMHHVASDRIEELESALSLRTALHGEATYVIKDLEAKLAKAVRLMDLSVELARWELNPKLQHDVIVFCNDLKGYNDEPNK